VDLAALEERLPALEEELALLLVPRDAERGRLGDPRGGRHGGRQAPSSPVISFGCTSATLSCGWSWNSKASPKARPGGYKEIIASIGGGRGVRPAEVRERRPPGPAVPLTEAQGRIHTSAATVAVLRKPGTWKSRSGTPTFRIDTYRVVGGGGSTSTERLGGAHHPPAHHIVVTSSERASTRRAKGDEGPSRQALRAEARSLHAERSQSRKSQVGREIAPNASGPTISRRKGDRPPDQSHPYDLSRIIAGEALDEVIDPLIAEDQAAAPGGKSRKAAVRPRPASRRPRRRRRRSVA